MRLSVRHVLVPILSLAWLACASSTPGGNIDADDQTGDADDGDGPSSIDGPDIDSSPIDGTTIDGTTIDGTTIDGSSIDAPAIDAAIDAMVDANTCPTQPCDLHQQCGCTSPLVCDLDFTDLMGTQCRAVNVAGTETSTCNSYSECAGGYICVGNPGRCRRYCDMDSDCGQPRGDCIIQIVDGNSQPIPGAVTCSSNCDPVNSAGGGGCPSGWKCGFFTVGTTDIVDCTTPGAGTQGASCTNDSTCASDYLCSTYNAATQCRRVCNRTTGGSECAAISGTSCVGFNPALTIGGTEYGVCAP